MHNTDSTTGRSRIVSLILRPSVNIRQTKRDWQFGMPERRVRCSSPSSLGPPTIKIAIPSAVLALYRHHVSWMLTAAHVHQLDEH
jgi:hypothetical protein